ncbi:MAG: NAD(P)-binding protein, partial [Desulfurococcales archaeon]|nr:NAD(P)-binding protein [Desulfurococcales archaeon]
MRIGVVGGGPAGLLAANVLRGAGYSVEIFEEHGRVGVPRHCTGIISEEVLRGIRSIVGSSIDNVVREAFTEYRVVGPSGSEVVIELPGRVYVTDRTGMEEVMLESAVSVGVATNLKTRVTHVTLDGKLHLSGGSRAYDRVVLAEGAAMHHSLRLGLCRKMVRLVGLQAFVEVHSPPDTVVVYALPEVSKDFFGWVVPYGPNEALERLENTHVRTQTTTAR